MKKLSQEHEYENEGTLPYQEHEYEGTLPYRWEHRQHESIHIWKWWFDLRVIWRKDDSEISRRCHLNGVAPNLHFPHLHQTLIYTHPTFTPDPNLHKPRFTPDPNLHKPRFTQTHFWTYISINPNLHNPNLHKTQIYTTQIYAIQIYTKPKFTQPKFTQK